MFILHSMSMGEQEAGCHTIVSPVTELTELVEQPSEWRKQSQEKSLR